MGGRDVMAAAEGANGGERWPGGGDDTDELSGLRESEAGRKSERQRWGAGGRGGEMLRKEGKTDEGKGEGREKRREDRIGGSMERERGKEEYAEAQIVIKKDHL